MQTLNRWGWEIHPIALLLMTLLGFGAIVFALHVLDTKTWQDIWVMPQGMGALLGSFFGLVGVAVSASIGFQTLRRGQEHAAHLARKQEFERAEAEARATAAALFGELRAIREALDDYARIRDMRQPDYDSIAASTPAAMLGADIVYYAVDRPVFASQVGKMGLLPTEIASQICFIHGEISNLTWLEGFRPTDKIRADMFRTLNAWASTKAKFINKRIDDVSRDMEEQGIILNVV